MTGLIPQAFIDELLNRTDIVELIDSQVPLKKQGASYVARCPFHSEKTPSFNVISKKQFYHCFGCGVSGNAISFMMEYLQQDFVSAIENLATRLGMEVPRDEASQKKQQFSKDHYQLLDRVTDYYQQQLKSNQLAVDYLKARGLSGDVAKKYSLGYAPKAWQLLQQQFPQDQKGLVVTGMLIEKDDGGHYDRYRDRIIFPIHDRRGRIIGFGGRCISPDDKPKYLNSPETVLFQKNKELYGLYQATLNNKELPHLIVVEGYMDVIALAQHDINVAVATLGTATSDAHIQLLSRHTKLLYFCFDGDKAGQQAARRALKSSFRHLAEGIDIRFAFLPQGQDPDSLVREVGKSGFYQELDKALPLNQFLFNTLLENVDISTLSGKTQLINKATEFLTLVPQGSYLNLLIQQLSRYTHIESDRLHTMMTQQSDGQTAPAICINPTKQVASSLKQIIALLLQAPEHYLAIKDFYDAELFNSAQYAVFNRLMQLLANAPNLKTANLLEYWRNDELFTVMQKLASWQRPVPEEGIKEELIDAMHHLETQAISQKIDHLIQQASQRGLSHEEKHQLQTMLKLRMNKNISAKSTE